MKAHKATGLAGVNTLFQAMMEHVKFNEIDFSNLTGTIAGGTALIKEIAYEWKQRTGSDIYEGYGLSETGAALACNIEGKRKLGTVGLPFKNMEVKLIDGAGAKAAKGESGELCLRGPQVMVGYWNRLAATAEVIDNDGWFKTGDVADIDHEGFIKIVDRIKDMVLVSGFNVYPTEIENVVYGHTDIVECAVVGVPDAKTGEAVKLYVNSSNPNLTAEALREFCKKELTAYKVPKNIEFLDELPKSPVGKILRRELRALKMRCIIYAYGYPFSSFE
jgi:long-chain acyl-CoA synthetase